MKVYLPLGQLLVPAVERGERERMGEMVVSGAEIFRWKKGLQFIFTCIYRKENDS